jgi:hypothetical protein
MPVTSSTNNKFAVVVLRVSRCNSTGSSLVAPKEKSVMTHCNATVLALGPAYLLFEAPGSVVLRHNHGICLPHVI